LKDGFSFFFILGIAWSTTSNRISAPPLLPEDEGKSILQNSDFECFKVFEMDYKDKRKM
jgi:hypothetical protein